MNITISVVLTCMIVIGGFIVGIANLIDILKSSKKKRRITDTEWTKWMYVLLGFYWCISYTILMFIPEGKEYAYTSMFIRPSMAILVFFLLLANQKPVYLPDLIRDFIKNLKEKGEKRHGKY